MDGRELHRLGRHLIELARQAGLDSVDADELPPEGEIAVLDDVIDHPGSSVGEITMRTGFAQSHVSDCVARLVDSAMLATDRDPRDRRRTLVYPTDALFKAIARRTPPRLNDALVAALGDPAAVRRVRALLTELADLLLPDRS
ncbi:MarR family transcriptional regulator [Nocardia sp. CA2R105]|uniref:MarR family transcriptional regulator n=1 Tax=Nocardia coffeae TaxID=2873381 RepID=UPI001CA668DE|nr:helix-turn-helix domain-containing protein [Nocardia coffeae]MBY8862350.1 MarR family transcriptional regulator [Nocardia coffeae]